MARPTPIDFQPMKSQYENFSQSNSTASDLLFLALRFLEFNFAFSPDELSCKIMIKFFILLTVLTVDVVYGMVAGVDFGGEFFKVALVKPGTPFEIVTNIHSKRKTETIVAFDGEDRLYGADAMNIGVRRPQFAYSQVRRLLGSQLTHPQVVSLTTNEYHPYELIHNATRGSIGLKHNGKTVFHAEELVAMIFSHARDITNEFANAIVKDWVVTVPSYFAQSQRQAILDAADISGVRVLSLIDENTAAALQYGIDHVYEKPYRVVYYNMGSTSLQVSVVEYNSFVVPDGFKKNKTVGSFDVLGKAWDETLGGAQFDLRLTEHLATLANAKLKIKQDIRTLARPMAKLRASARKTKVVLSANEQIPVVIQSLHDDRDFMTKVTRPEFENMCQDLFERSLQPVHAALEQAGLQVNEIDAVEIIGGGVRVPKIQKLLKDLFQKDLSVHLNGDEAMALGSAFRAANISNAFRVRTVGMNDISSFPIGVRLVDLEQQEIKDTTEEKHWVKRATLFKKNNRLNARKSVSFVHDEDISCTFRYDKPSELPQGVDTIISQFNITGIQAFAQEMKDIGKPKVSLSFLLDMNGIARIAKAEATVEEELPPQPEPEPVVEEETAETTDDKTEEDSTKPTTEEDSKKTTEKDLKPKEEAPKTKIHRKTLTIVASADQHEAGMGILPMSIAEKKESIAMLKELQRLDDIRIANAQAKNELESYIYSSRDQLDTSRSELEKANVAKPEALDKLLSEINDAEEWLYGEGSNVEASDYIKRHESIKNQLDGMMFRLSESTSRPAAVTRATAYIKSTREMMTEWESSKPQVKEDERNEVVARLESLEKWITEKTQAQEKLELDQKPAFTSSETLKQLKEIKRYVAFLSKRPKPEPPKAPVNETESNTTTESTDAPKTEEPATETPVETKEEEPKRDEL